MQNIHRNCWQPKSHSWTVNTCQKSRNLSPAFSAINPTTASSFSSCRSLMTMSMFCPVCSLAERRPRKWCRREDGYRMAEVQPGNWNVSNQSNVFYEVHVHYSLVQWPVMMVWELSRLVELYVAYQGPYEQLHNRLKLLKIGFKDLPQLQRHKKRRHDVETYWMSLFPHCFDQPYLIWKTHILRLINKTVLKVWFHQKSCKHRNQGELHDVRQSGRKSLVLVRVKHLDKVPVWVVLESLSK